MTHRTPLIALSLIATGCFAASAHAALEGRDLDGNLSTFEAYYDTDLDITWLADANYAQTSGYNADGLMTWEEAVSWANNLEYWGYNDWRLPTTTDSGEIGCDFAYGGTDCGYNVDPASSELAHLYHQTLGNLSFFTNTGADSGAFEGGSDPDSTLDNVGPFINFQPGGYWSGTEFMAEPEFFAWGFGTFAGFQNGIGKSDVMYALAVRPGDVAAVPEAETYAMLLAGLGLIGWRARRRG
ncbi:MAG: hypothetical protein B7Y26_01600 [Hydrogenophilales bacterium 16-64-46]|nr:MAG: hypothetical protein B7Z32_01300 [Hydrogenophilales bacterium 12-64-13]OYZ06528.1 MAG: hypothetical protein B7Y26_01600 [Hydrogenophilales bacterium 16-64-46]OZA39236.1 MAG: hypothetical protein B7X87_02705 [Hydrogenophilales bacterium 17-64-34]HQS98787.1 PEP-CTERM sorting domain-containing protein [Thiobacillus sp.]